MVGVPYCPCNWRCHGDAHPCSLSCLSHSVVSSPHHSVGGGAETPASSPPMSTTTTIKHGTARRYVEGCRCVDCTRAYKSTMKALGLEETV